MDPDFEDEYADELEALKDLDDGKFSQLYIIKSSRDEEQCLLLPLPSQLRHQIWDRTFSGMLTGTPKNNQTLSSCHVR